MKKLIFIFLATFLSNYSSAQTSEKTNVTDTLDYMKMEHPPQFTGGVKAFEKYISKNLKYPTQAIKNGIMGIVQVHFLINKDGVVVDPQVFKSLDKVLDVEAIKLIQKMPAWQPGKQNGQNVAVRYMIPVRFMPSY
ncbi:MAG: energy transducer TonB [Pedobacter sp.]|nr:MAG: energy transducer TonB [Pedobacter sp.]